MTKQNEQKFNFSRTVVTYRLGALTFPPEMDDLKLSDQLCLTELGTVEIVPDGVPHIPSRTAWWHANIELGRSIILGGNISLQNTTTFWGSISAELFVC